MGANEVMGIQEKGVGVSLKHFAGNNSENYRFMGNSIIDNRALREIYLRQFEYIVKTAKPETLMCAYNKINGVYCSENNWLLNEVLRKDWGFNGLVMSDWGTTHNRILGVKSGLDLEMPGDTLICRKWLFDAVNNGELSMDELDKAVRNVLTLVEKHHKDEKSDSVPASIFLNEPSIAFDDTPSTTATALISVVLSMTNGSVYSISSPPFNV